MARGKGSVPGTGEKKAAWGHTELAAVVYSARKREEKKKVSMFLHLWGGRKVNYPHWKKKKMLNKGTGGTTGDPHPSAASKPQVMVRVGQIKRILPI